MTSSTSDTAELLPPQISDSKKRRKNKDVNLSLEATALFGIFMMLVLILLMISLFAIEHKNKYNNDFYNIKMYESCEIPDFPTLEEILKINKKIHAAKKPNESLKPKVYNFAQVRCGALVENGFDRTRILADKFEAAILIIFESIKIHTYPDEREWFDMCNRINQKMYEEFGGKWNCIASDKPILSSIQPNDSFMNIKLQDLFFEIYR